MMTDVTKRDEDKEVILLSGALADPALSRLAIDRGLAPRDFISPVRASLWRLFLEADEAGEELTPDVLIRLSQDGPNAKAADQIARGAARWPNSKIIYQRALDEFLFSSRCRRARSDANEALAKLKEATSDEDLEEFARQMREAADAAMEVSRRPILTASHVASTLRERITDPRPKLETGIQKLDHVLGGGLDRGRMISLIGKYKIGKTTLLSTIGYNVAYGAGEKNPDNRAKVLFVTLERNQTDVEMLNAARAMGTNIYRLERNFDDYSQEFEAYLRDPLRSQILYYHRPGASLGEIVSVITRAVRQHGIALAMVDYYQIVVKPKSARLIDHLMNVDQTLARVAAELDISIVIAAQSDADGNPRDSKTLLHAAAANFAIRRTEGSPEAWLDNLASNYLKQRDAGSPSSPAMTLQEDVGPHFASV